MYTPSTTQKFIQSNADTSPKRSVPPSHWATACTDSESTLHQLSPYIGKLKSVIARDLIVKYSKPGGLVADMFCGSGTIPLEAALLGRRVFASDASVYAMTLTRAKLQAPSNTDQGLYELESLLSIVERLPLPELGQVPKWVREFFHPKTLKECIRVSEYFKSQREYFFLACLLGILHHQRPGFLSYPSSHLVPYLRTKKFSKANHPHLYEYRPVVQRLKSKIVRALKRTPQNPLSDLVVGTADKPVEFVDLPENIDCVITSPPYMNAIDYVRDNRLRLWFLGEVTSTVSDQRLSSPQNFRSAITSLAVQIQARLRTNGYCVFIVADRTIRNGHRFPCQELVSIFSQLAPSLVLQRIVTDVIPDIRRSRKYLAGVKHENILIYKKQ